MDWHPGGKGQMPDVAGMWYYYGIVWRMYVVVLVQVNKGVYKGVLEWGFIAQVPPYRSSG